MFLKGHAATPPSQGAGPQGPAKFWDLLHARTHYEKQPCFARWWTCKDKDKDQAYKDQDKDKD